VGNLGRTWPRGRLAWAPERIEGCEFSVIFGSLYLLPNRKGERRCNCVSLIISPYLDV
jgi:hypothetical protein